MDRTLIIAKPDAVERGLVSEILGRFERRGLKIVGLKLMQVSRELAEQHYAEHQGKPFFPDLVSFITSGPVVVGVLEAPQAVTVVRTMMGKTNPLDSQPGSIRGDLALSLGNNVIHGSDSPESARREIALFFQPGELYEYERPQDVWIYGKQG